MSLKECVGIAQWERTRERGKYNRSKGDLDLARATRVDTGTTRERGLRTSRLGREGGEEAREELSERLLPGALLEGRARVSVSVDVGENGGTGSFRAMGDVGDRRRVGEGQAEGG